MKKFLYPLLMVFCGLVVTGCADFAIPSKIQIKADPEFNLPLGIKLDISKYLDMDKILGDLSESVPDLKIYKYTNTAYDLGGGNTPATVQTYLMRYPIANMPLDLGESVPSQIDLGTVPVPSIPAEATAALSGKALYAANDGLYIKESEWTELNLVVQSVLTTAGFKHAAETAIPPMTSIDLQEDVELGKWMKDILLASGVGITIEGDKSAAIELAVPALGVGAKNLADTGASTYAAGTYAGGKTSYTDTDSSYSTLLPESGANADNTTLKVYVKIKDTSLLSGDLHLGLNFNWTTAKVKPGSAGAFENSFPMPDLSGLTEMLGGLKFASVPAYLYVGGMSGTNATMKLSAEETGGGTHHFLSGGSGGTSITMDKTLTGLPAGEGIPAYDGAIPAHSATFDMKGLLNGDYTDDLNYSVAIAEATITNGTDNAKSITADLLLVLPVYFDVDLTSADAAKLATDYDPFLIDGTQYIKVNLSMLDGISDITGDDLLESVRETLDEYAKITELSLDLNITKNDILDGLSLGIKNGDTWQILDLAEGESSSFEFTDGDINPELKLSIAVLMEEDAPGSKKGALSLKPDGAGFDIKITAGAKIDIDATL